MRDRGWKYYPALKIALLLATGIVVADLLAFSPLFPLAALAPTLLWLAIAARYDRPLIILPTLLLPLLSGALLHSLRNSSPIAGLEGARFPNVELLGRVAAEPVDRENRIEYIVDCDSILDGSFSVAPGGRMLVRLYDTAVDRRQLPIHGDRVSVVGDVAVPSRPTMPGEFDAAAYFRSQGIVLTMTTDRAQSLHIISRDNLSRLERSIVLPIRRAARRFAHDVVRGEEGDIVRALLLGEREYIDAPTREAFMRTGTIHALAVSGLHVGVIALALFVLVSWLPSRPAQFVAYTTAMTLYAVVAGGSPSIVRAAIMSTAFLGARLAGRIARPLNTLGLAALVILLARPADLFDVGFQLSFAAVAGIIVLYEPLRSAFVERFGLIARFTPLRWTTQMLLLSLCAQIFTFPLALYHFGYLPLTALPVNIVVVPLVSAALAASALGVLCTAITPVAAWFGGAAYLLTATTEEIVRRSAELPLAGIEAGRIGILGLILIETGAIVTALARHPIQTAWRTTTLAILVFCVICAERMFDPLRNSGENYLYILPTPRGQAVAAHHGDSITIYAQNGHSRDSIFLRYAADGLRRRLGATVARVVDPATEASAFRVTEIPAEYALRRIPVVISVTSQRRLAVVRAADERLLQVPTAAMLNEALALRYTDQWELIAWR